MQHPDPTHFCCLLMWEHNCQEVRDLLGIGTCIGGLALPVWHVMPVFLDLKIAQDPSLPGLSTETLPITTTVTGCMSLTVSFFTVASWVLHGSFIFKAPMTFDILCIIPFSTAHFLNDKWPAWNPSLACHDHKDLRSASDAAETDRTFLSVGFRFFGVGPVASPLVSVWWGHLCWLACKCPHLGSSIRLSDMSKVVERVGPPSFSAKRNRLKNPLLISFHAIWGFFDFYKRLIADSCWFIQLQGRISYHEQIWFARWFNSKHFGPWLEVTIYSSKDHFQPERSQFEMSGGQFLLVSPFLARSLYISSPWIWDCSWFQSWLTPDLGSWRVHKSQPNTGSFPDVILKVRKTYSS